MSLAAKSAPLDSPQLTGGACQQLRISLLGEFYIRQGDTAVPVDTPSHRALLAYLLLNPKQIHPRQHLAFTFWPNSTESQARTNLRKALFHLRRLLPKPDLFLQVNRTTVTWCEDAPYRLDVDDFVTAVNQIEKATSPAKLLSLLEKAPRLYKGELLPGHYAEWILTRREALRQQYLTCLTRHMQLLEEARDYAKAVIPARLLLLAEPLNEATYRRLMRLQALSDDRAGALHSYHVCSNTLQRELNIAPSIATQEAYRNILALDAAVLSQTRRRIPLVGRKQAWTKLQFAWKQAAQGRPFWALVRGEVGIGKTRLAEELLNWATRQGIMSLRTACYAPVSNLPYGPVATLLRNKTMHLHLDQLDDKWLREISRVLPEVVAGRPELKPGGPIVNSWQRQHLFSALAQAVLMQRQPFILFIDDLQWCDLDTMEWLCFLLHFKSQARFLILSAVREEEIATNPSLASLLCGLQQNSDFVEIELSRLDQAATTDLARYLTGQRLEAAQTAWLFAETEGIPLFIVEMARAGLAILGDNGQLAPSDSKGPIPLPDKMRAVIEWRLSNLSPTARELLELAATIGRFFTFDLLVAASGQTEPELVRALDELWQHQIVREQGTERYDFSHDKLRQVTYTSLSSAKRRLLHGRIIKALETLYAHNIDKVCAQLAVHYEARQRWPKAIEYYRRAAHVSNRIFAHQETMQHLRRAIALLPKTKLLARQKVALYEQLGDVLALTGEYKQAREALATTVSLSNQAIEKARLLGKQGNTWTTQQRHEMAGDIYSQALQLLAKAPVGDRWWSVWLDLQLGHGNGYYYTARLAELEECIRQLWGPVASFGTSEQRRRVLKLHKMLVFQQKRFRLDADDVTLSQQILELAQQIGVCHQIAECQFDLGFAILWSGQVARAINVFTDSLQQAEHSGDIFLQDQCLAYLTVAYRLQGDEGQTQTLINEHHRINTQAGNPAYRGVLQGNKAWLSYRSGDMATAVTQGEAALATWGDLPYPLKWVALWPLLAATAAEQRPADAVDYGTLLLAPAQQRLGEDVTAVLQQARTAWQNNQPELTHNLLRNSMQLAQELGYL